MDKKYPIIIIVLVLLLAISVLYYFTRAGSSTAATTHSTSTIPANTTNSAQTKLLNGGGKGNSYISETELESLMLGNSTNTYAAVLCNQTYQSNSISCPSIFPKYQKLYGKNITVWLITYSTPTEHLSEIVIKSNITAARHEYNSFTSGNTIFYNYNRSAAIFNRTINATFNDGIYSVLSQEVAESNPPINLKPTKGQDVLNLMVLAKGQEVTAMVLISPNYNTILNTALIKTATNDMP